MTLVDEYIKQLNEVELLALQIAKEDLESSFTLSLILLVFCKVFIIGRKRLP